MVQKSYIKYQKVSEEWTEKKVFFMYLDSSLKTNTKKSAAEMALYSTSLPLYLDSKQKLARKLMFETTNQAVIFDVKNEKVIYKGAIDSSLN